MELRGLPKKYDGLYDGNLLEDEIEKMNKWSNRSDPAHPDWISTKSMASTGEVFGLINAVDRMAIDDDDKSDKSLNEEADAALAELEHLPDFEEEMVDSTTEEVSGLVTMPESSRWLAEQLGKFRPSCRVKGKVEWATFREMLPNYQRQGRHDSDEADNFSSIAFSA